jgi:hypothetical protein
MGAGAIAFRLGAGLDEKSANRARAIIDDFARRIDIEPPEWHDGGGSLEISDVSVHVAEATWDYAKKVRENLLDIRPGVRIGACSAVGEDAQHVRALAELLADKAREGDIALGWALVRQLANPIWDEVEVESGLTQVIHFPANGSGRSGVEFARLIPVGPIGRYVGRDLDYPKDAEGFLELPASRSVRRVEELAQESRALILGDPWMGKTWVATQMEKQLGARSDFVWKLSFERDVAVPHDWERWKHSGQHGYVLIDAMDEGFYRGVSVGEKLRFLRDIGTQSPLHIFAFSRESHKDRSVNALGWTSVGTPYIWHLYPLDADRAAVALARPGEWTLGRERVEQVRHHIRRLDDERLVRDYNVLARLAESADPLTAEDLELRVIEHLCSGKGDIENTALDVRVEAAARVAAVLQFSDVEFIDLDDESYLPRDRHSPVKLDEAFPRDGDGKRAVRALARSSLFERNHAQGYRFRQHFAKERLAAHALRNASNLLVRRLLTGPRGGVLLAHKAVVDRLATTVPNRRSVFEQLEREAPRALESEKAARLFDALLEAVGTSDLNLGRDRALSAMADRAVASRALAVIADSGRTEGQRRVALDIAEVNADAAPGWEPLSEVALAVALDSTAPADLRKACTRTIYRLERARVLRPQLDALCAEELEDTAGLRAVVLTAKLEAGAEALTIAAHAPVRVPGLIDDRAFLFDSIVFKLSDAEVRIVLDQRLGIVPMTLPPHALNELFGSSFGRWCGFTWEKDDFERLLRVAECKEYAWELESAISAKAEGDSVLRRALFEVLLDAKPHWIQLKPEDAEWLAGYVQGKVNENLATRAYGFLRTQTVADEPRGRVEAWLHTHHAKVIEIPEGAERAGERGRAEELRQEQELRKNTPRRRALAMRDVSEVTQEILAADISPIEQIRHLGWVLFTEERLRPRNVVGSYDSLGPALQKEVVTALAKAFASAVPTELPSATTSSYPSTVMYEARAFSAMVLHREGDWPSASLVARWLRSALFMSAPDIATVTHACLRAAEAETKTALLEALRRDASHRNDSRTAQILPSQIFDDPGFVGATLDIAAAPSVRAPAVADIVWTLAGRVGARLIAALGERTWPSAIEPIIVATRTYLEDGGRIGAVLGRISDVAGVDVLEPLYRDRLGDSPWFVDVQQWRSPPRLMLAEWLLPRFPLTEVTPPFDGLVRVTTATRRIELRDSVLSALVHRSDELSRSSLRKLSSDHPSIAEWDALVQRQRAVDEILRQIEGEPESIPPREIATMLDAGAPTSLRGADDLFVLLMETIEGTIKGDTSPNTHMIWQNGGAPTAREPNERRLLEYLRTRLKDLLSARSSVLVQPIVEPTLGHGDRPDLMIEVASQNAQHAELERVVIELKWSHDSRLHTDMEKLVTNYLGDNQGGHGIYVVGYSGSPAGGVEPLEQQLRQQASELQDEHPSKRVGVVVLPVVRPAPARAKARKPAPRGAGK